METGCIQSGCCKSNLQTMVRVAQSCLKEQKSKYSKAADFDVALGIKNQYKDTLELLTVMAKTGAEQDRAQTKDSKAIGKLVSNTLKAEKARHFNIYRELGSYQGALEVIASVGGGLTPGVIPAAAVNVLNAKRPVLSCYDSDFDEGLREKALYNAGVDALRDVAEAADCKMAYEIAKVNKGEATLRVLKELPADREKKCRN